MDVLSLCDKEMLLNIVERFSQCLGHAIELASHYSEVSVLVANKAKDQIEDWLCHIMQSVRRNEERLELIVLEGLRPELDILVADVCQNCCLRVDFVILARFSNYRAFYIAEQTK